jgi:uncharacterized membrane protein YagU involved in acid resistance
MKDDTLLLDIGVGMLAGLVATKVTEYAQQALWAATPEETRRKEQRVRLGPPFRVAAEKSADLAGLHLDEKETMAAGMAFHYASGIGWGPVYCVMRRAAGMNSLGAGIAAGMSMSILLDELVTPALGFSAPNRDYPPAAHVRGLLGHLVYGLALAGTAEGLYRLAAEPGELSRPDTS